MIFTITKHQLKVVTTVAGCASAYWLFTVPLDQAVIATSLLFIALVGLIEARNGN